MSAGPSRNSCRPEIFFSLATQFENLGDCLINQLLLEQLSESCRVVVLGRSAPDWLVRRLARHESIVLCRRPGEFFAALFDTLKQGRPAGLVFKPGHWVARPGVFQLGRLATLAALTASLRARRWQVFRLGVSLGDYSRAEAWLQGLLGRQHSLYGLRDEASADLARSLGIIGSSYTPDLAFLLPLCSHAPGPAGTRRLSLSFRSRRWMAADTSTWPDLLNAMQTTAREGGQRLTVIEQVDFDHSLTDEIRQRTGADVVRFVGSERGAQEVFRAHAETDILVGNRLHALIFAWAEGAIPLAVADGGEDRKIRGLFAELGLDELVLEPEELPRLPERLRLIQHEAAAWRERLHSIFHQQQQLLSRTIASLCFRLGAQPSSSAS
jgi:hypothetical protein